MIVSSPKTAYVHILTGKYSEDRKYLGLFVTEIPVDFLHGICELKASNVKSRFECHIYYSVHVGKIKEGMCKIAMSWTKQEQKSQNNDGRI